MWFYATVRKIIDKRYRLTVNNDKSHQYVSKYRMLLTCSKSPYSSSAGYSMVSSFGCGSERPVFCNMRCLKFGRSDSFVCWLDDAESSWVSVIMFSWSGPDSSVWVSLPASGVMSPIKALILTFLKSQSK